VSDNIYESIKDLALHLAPSPSYLQVGRTHAKLKPQYDYLDLFPGWIEMQPFPGDEREIRPVLFSPDRSRIYYSRYRVHSPLLRNTIIVP